MVQTHARAAALLVMLSLVLVPMTTLATHNSFGAHNHFIQADEFDRTTGELTPDIPHDQSPYVQRFHENLVVDGLTARVAPPDQTGDRYSDCTPWSAYGGDEAAYEADLDDGTACYVGYFDHQLEYTLVGSFVLVSQAPIDALYPYNPDPEDDYCTGREDPVDPLQDNGIDGDAPQAADELYTRVLRSNEGGKCGPVSGEHQWRLPPGDTAVDTDLLEAGVEIAAETTGTQGGSGTLSLPFTGGGYTFLFGQPHPENDNPSEFAAGSGVFGANPAEGGNPINDISGACGDRTRECALLTPEDVKAFDPYADEFADDLARVCAFQPQYTYGVIGAADVDRDKAVCGNTGNRADSFLDSVSAGGFGVDGAPATWSTNLPGWYWGVLYTPTQWAGDNNQDFVDDFSTEEQSFRDGWLHYWAVNPRVPAVDGPMNCVAPNFLATGGTVTGPEGGIFNDPGVYGTYQADAIDADVFVNPLLTPQRDARDATHGTVAPLVIQANEAADDAEGEAQQAVDSLNLPPEVTDLSDRADYLESAPEEPHAQLGPQNQKSFDLFRSKGLRCDALGVLSLQTEDTTFDGGLRFNANMVQNTVSLKDPTLLDGGLPARESDTTEGAWMVDQYSFNGVIHGVLDTNQDGDLDDCANPGGAVQPNDDFCAWEAIWDAYNPGCADFATRTCGEILITRGYDINGSDNEGNTLANPSPTGTGVGLYFVAKVTGPLVWTNENPTVPVVGTLGLGDTTAQNCIVGISVGFEDHLVAQLGFNNLADLEADLCSDANGESVTIVDAFSDQSADTPGGFSSAVSWAKLLPSPDAVEGATDIGAGDGLCVTGMWNVQNGEITKDTAGNLDLDSSQTWTFSDCDSFETQA